MDGDHSTLVLAPKANKDFIVKREKRTVKTRPLPESNISAFCAEMTQHKWSKVFESQDVDEKTEEYHKYIRELLDKYCPERTICVTNLDKPWMNPQLKQLLRQVQRERLRHGKGGSLRSYGQNTEG